MENIYGWTEGDFMVTSYWETRKGKIGGLHMAVENFETAKKALIGPPGAEPDWPSATAWHRWNSRSLDQLIGIGMTESEAEKALDEVFC